MVEPYGYSMDQSADGAWRNSQYGFVRNITPPGVSPLHPAQQVYYALRQNQYDQNTHGNASNPYVPEYAIPSITGSSPPPTVGPHSALAANSSSTDVDILNAEDLPEYYTATEREYSGRKQPLVVVGDSGSEDGMKHYDRIQTKMPDSQLSPTEEKPTSSRIRSSRPSL